MLGAQRKASHGSAHVRHRHRSRNIHENRHIHKQHTVTTNIQNYQKEYIRHYCIVKKDDLISAPGSAVNYYHPLFPCFRYIYKIARMHSSLREKKGRNVL
jgi:hypothetical protein